MNVRAKFRCTAKGLKSGAGEEEYGTVYLEPVIGGNPENESFYKWTPAGRVELETVNVGAFRAFELNGEYYVDFSPAE